MPACARALRSLVIGALALALLGCASPRRDDYLRHSVVAPPEERAQGALVLELDPSRPIDFRGEFDPDNGITTGNPLYAGDAGVAGLAVQVAAHAILSSSMQEKRLREQQEAGNRVLDAWQPFLAQLRQRELLDNSGLAPPPTGEQDLHVVVSSPIFYMARDQQSLFVRHLIKVRRAGKPEHVYQNLVEMHAPLRRGEAPAGSDAANAALHGTTLELYRESLQLGIADYRGQFADPSAREQTVRFDEGRIERGVLLADDCAQRVVRSLRGWLIAYRKSDTAGCVVPH